MIATKSTIDITQRIAIALQERGADRQDASHGMNTRLAAISANRSRLHSSQYCQISSASFRTIWYSASTSARFVSILIYTKSKVGKLPILSANASF